MISNPYGSVNSVQFGYVHSSPLAPVNTHVHEKAFSLSYHATVVSEQLIPFIKGSFSR